MPKFTPASFHAVLSSARPATSMVAGILAAATLYFEGSISFISSLLRIFPIVLVTMTGFISNDIGDRKKDALARRERPIATGRLSVKTAKRAVVILALWALILEGYYETYFTFLIIALTLVGVLVYTVAAQRIPLVKNLFTAMLCCAPLAYASAISNHPIPISEYLFLCMFIIGRELILDLMDLQGDLLYGIKTWPAHLGEKVSRFVGWAGMWLSAVLFVITLHTYRGEVYAMATLISLGICMGISIKRERLALALTKIPMILGAFALAASRM